MNKKDLIQRAAVAFTAAFLYRGKKSDLDKSIRWAEALWDRLTAHGYGSPKQQAPRDTIDWYARLQGAGRATFDAFWHAFNYRVGRNGAAMRWYQLGDLTEAQAQRITEAAACEAERPLAKGCTRKMAQGWLAERRWEDYAIAPARSQRDTRRQDIRNEIASLRQLEPADASGNITRQIEKLKDRLRAIEVTDDRQSEQA